MPVALPFIEWSGNMSRKGGVGGVIPRTFLHTPLSLLPILSATEHGYQHIYYVAGFLVSFAVIAIYVIATPGEIYRSGCTLLNLLSHVIDPWTNYFPLSSFIHILHHNTVIVVFESCFYTYNI